MERGRAVDGRRVDVDGLLPQQRADRLGIALPGSVDQIDGRTSRRPTPAPASRTTDSTRRNIRIGSSCTLISKIGQAAGAVAQRVDRHADFVEQGDAAGS